MWSTLLIGPVKTTTGFIFQKKITFKKELCNKNFPKFLDSTPHYTFEERLIQKPIEGRRYEPTIDIDRYSRAKSLTRSDTLRNYSKKGNYLASELASCRAWRAASEMRAYSSRSSREPSLTRGKSF